jgi:hypothetical protein
MLSVVLYGRNDSHGYNLHKRAAISLNAIAEMLTDPDDEILFVDYNTPDDLPTFPEAIADTLSEKAQARLKVLRVRADVHRERFAAKTHLVALEPIARNVAIRRSNPNNRWVLSTNTDMIFCPRASGSTLSSIAAALKDGFYHLPRFELPEGLWETLDRKDAPAIVASAREWGERFHLNEITYSGGDNVYDGPGDFQLFLREDLFKIGGFHEEMIIGWHLDANVARRMRLLRGEVSSALDHLVGYHCDHTRQASAYHKIERLENDPVRYVDEVTSPQVPEQMASWGLADVNVESFRLGEASGARYLKGIEAVVAGRLTGFLETRYVAEDHGRMAYEADHVLPYLLDLVSCVPADTRIGYVGARRDTFDKFVRGWRAMGGQSVLAPASASWLPDGEGVRRVSDAAWAEETELFVFEVGSEAAQNQIDFSPEESGRLWVVDRAFKRAVDADLARQAQGAAARRVLVVNGIHNFFEPQVLQWVSITLTPFSSRIRHGYIRDRAAARAAAGGPAAREAMAILQALEPLSVIETRRLNDLFGRLDLDQLDDPAWEQAARAAAEIDALAAAGLMSSIDDDKAMARMAELNRRRASVRFKSVGIDPSAGQGAPNRLVRTEDWDDPAWASLARRLFSNRDHADIFQREIWTWERVTLAQNLETALPPSSGGAVLVCGEHPERLAFTLAHEGYAVDIADPHALAREEFKANDWREEFAREGWVSPRPVGLIDDRAAQIEAGFRYDAVVIPQNGLFAEGRAAAADVLKAASGLIKPGGHIGFLALVQPLAEDERLREHALPHGLAAGGFAEALKTLAGLDLTGPADPRMTPRSLDRATAGEDGAGPPALVHGAGSELDATSAWSLAKSSREADWATFKMVMDAGVYGDSQPSGPAGATQSVLFGADDLRHLPPLSAAPRLGDLFDTVVPAEGLTRTPLSLRAPASFGVGLAAMASLGRVPPGSYELEVDVEVTALAEPGLVLAIGVAAPGGLVCEEAVNASDLGLIRVRMALEVGKNGAAGLAALFKVQGRADLDILTLALR